MEKQLKCVLMLSLKEMVLRRMAGIFWSDSKILTSISKFQMSWICTEVSEREWRECIEDKIKDKMLKLDLPKSLTKSMIDIARPIGLEIREWKKFHLDFFQEGLFQSLEEIGLPVLEKLCWTSTGRIDNQKTAEELVRCDALDLRDRYQLACLYCLEDYIPIFWKDLPEEQKDYFCIEEELLPDLHFCWPHIFKGELSRVDYLLRTYGRNLTTFNQWAFEDSVVRGNKTAAEYFFRKLTYEEKEASLMRSAHKILSDPEAVYCLAERLSDVLFYLLSLMSPQQQMEIIKAHPVSVLLCFFYWPWQDLLDLGIWDLRLIWTFISRSAYPDLLDKLIEISNRSNFSYYFQEFFKQSPLNFKEYFLEYERNDEIFFSPAYYFLSKFFSFEDSESIEVIFRNFHAADRVKLVFNPLVLNLFYKSILRDRWHMVELCLREAMLSKADRNNLKKAFTEFVERRNLEQQNLASFNWSRNNECVNAKLRTFFEFLDETDTSTDKGRKAPKHKLSECSPEK